MKQWQIILLGLFIILMMFIGLSSIIYGLYIIWSPLAYVIGGLFIMGLALSINNAIPSPKGGEK
ncbi:MULTISPECIES: hypothetical protein [Mammaliicoccus]|uniref:hypothetical protein n=1 Tax=Mammaliicoccus TaxID=2803850 RepID=UPI0018E118E8|nr:MULTISPECIES: hypothetical protein [Mammaliicoccus]MCJ1774686.1 hypothetical protein [Mammaliicoccus sciuri]MEB5649004.1 hypothetical protein [Mammaliicoccus sciuri]QQC96569.1 hypothetical protein JCQ35_05995 [Mammaliicoccus sciuri]